MKQIILVLFCACLSPLFASQYDQAYQSYQDGEEASLIVEREKHFNEALELYTANEQVDGKLYYNIANCYYQLNQVGMAIWYYHKAEQLLPRDVKIKENLLKAQEVAKATPTHWEVIKKQTFFWHYLLNPQERSIAFIGLAVLAFIVGSYYFWVRKTLLKYLTMALVVGCSAVGISLSAGKQSARLGVFVQPSLLRCDAGMQYVEVDSEILTAGQKFKVLEISSDQQWLKVKTQKNKKGYVPSSQVRLL
ncbi:MAG: hypothetical protein S4CHLAM6_16110 [Chlamydiae bacterium]|nr:hypothetical protein [Chlamydiota bacterium]